MEKAARECALRYAPRGPASRPSGGCADFHEPRRYTTGMARVWTGAPGSVLGAWCRAACWMLGAWCCAACWVPGVAEGAGPQPSSISAELRSKFERRLQDIATQVDGVMGYAILDLTSGDRIGHLDRDVFPTASTIKLAIVYELFKQVDEGRIRLDQYVPLDHAKAVGGSGVLFELGTPTLSIRDYATLMVIVSDNTATNVLLDLLGVDTITARMRALGLPETKLRRHMIDLAAARRGDENVSTPADIVRLLEIISKG